MSNNKDLKPVFIPALSAILLNAEDEKGSPLTNNEVIEIRDSAAVIMMEEIDAEKMVESRGYDDLDPENVWYDWQMVRRELGRKPDIDPGTRFSFVNTDSEFQKTIIDARNTLKRFRNLIEKKSSDNLFPLVKTEISDSSYKAFMWLYVVDFNSDKFIGELFEVPTEFTEFSVGDRFELSENDVLDWMINDNGTLHGGFSLRYQRDNMTSTEREKFDNHIGITELA